MQDPTGDMATIARKGCHSVRLHRDKKEALKAQKKEWELAGTNIGNIMGIQKKEEVEVCIQFMRCRKYLFCKASKTFIEQKIFVFWIQLLNALY